MLTLCADSTQTERSVIMLEGKWRKTLKLQIRIILIITRFVFIYI